MSGRHALLRSGQPRHRHDPAPSGQDAALPRRPRRSRRWYLRSLLAAVAVAALLPATALDPASVQGDDDPPPRPATAGTPTATTFTGIPTVGALFLDGADGNHNCTGSVIRSDTGDLVLTAAHCVAGSGTGMQFVPMYHDGIAPYGAWNVTAVYADPAWITDQRPQSDFALLRLAPQLRGGRLVTIQDVVGGNTLDFSGGPGERVQLVGYPAGIDDKPVTCVGTTYDQQGFLGFDCHGFAPGTSGAPWLVPPPIPGTGVRGAPAGTSVPGVSGLPAPTGLEVTGIIGGLHQGGCDESISYSPSFGVSLQLVYQRAVDRGPADVLPQPGGDDC